MEQQISERPKRLTDAAAKRAAHRILETLAKHNYPVAPDDDYSVEAMAKILSFSTCDGYDLARRMEDADILDRSDIDAGMVGLLDDYSYVVNDEIKNDIRTWVVENGIVPTMGVGDKVKVVDGYPDKDLLGQEGEIIEVDGEAAIYVVKFPGLGHVGYGNGTGTCGTCLPFEGIVKI